MNELDRGVRRTVEHCHPLARRDRVLEQAQTLPRERIAGDVARPTRDVATRSPQAGDHAAPDGIRIDGATIGIVWVAWPVGPRRIGARRRSLPASRALPALGRPAAAGRRGESMQRFFIASSIGACVGARCDTVHRGRSARARRRSRELTRLSATRRQRHRPVWRGLPPTIRVLRTAGSAEVPDDHPLTRPPLPNTHPGPKIQVFADSNPIPGVAPSESAARPRRVRYIVVHREDTPIHRWTRPVRHLAQRKHTQCRRRRRVMLRQHTRTRRQPRKRCKAPVTNVAGCSHDGDIPAIWTTSSRCSV